MPNPEELNNNIVFSSRYRRIRWRILEYWNYTSEVTLSFAPCPTATTVASFTLPCAFSGMNKPLFVFYRSNIQHYYYRRNSPDSRLSISFSSYSDKNDLQLLVQTSPPVRGPRVDGIPETRQPASIQQTMRQYQNFPEHDSLLANSPSHLHFLKGRTTWNLSLTKLLVVYTLHIVMQW